MNFFWKIFLRIIDVEEEFVIDYENSCYDDLGFYDILLIFVFVFSLEKF